MDITNKLVITPALNGIGALNICIMKSVSNYFGYSSFFIPLSWLIYYMILSANNSLSYINIISIIIISFINIMNGPDKGFGKDFSENFNNMKSDISGRFRKDFLPISLMNSLLYFMINLSYLIGNKIKI